MSEKDIGYLNSTLVTTEVKVGIAVPCCEEYLNSTLVTTEEVYPIREYRVHLHLNSTLVTTEGFQHFYIITVTKI